MIKVYIASPYSKGDVAVNVARQMTCANILIDTGFAPFAPLLFHFQHLHSPKSYKIWMTLDFEWVKSCDVLLRLSGDSEGADREVEFAKNIGIPVVFSLGELWDAYPKNKTIKDNK